MKVIVDKNNKIVDKSPYNEITDSVKAWLETNNFKIMDIENPVVSEEKSEDGMLTTVFRDLTEAEILADEKYEAKSVGEPYVLNETEYLIPFMKDDADGMVQVTLGFMKGAISETVIHFSNGVQMPIKATEFDTFALWFAEKRNSFFMG